MLTVRVDDNYFIDNDLRGGIIAQNPAEEGWSGGPVKRLCRPARSGIPTRRDSDGDNPEEWIITLV